MPISKIKCYNLYKRHGLRVIGDLFNEGIPQNYNTFGNIPNLNFIEFNSLILKLNRSWKHAYREKTQNGEMVMQVKNVDIVSLLLSKTDLKFVYWMFVNKILKYPLKCQEKWQSVLHFRNELNWNDIYDISSRCTKETKIISFQYKICHRILFTNYMLHKMKLVADEFCTFCRRETETLEHIFYHCYYTSKVIEDFNLWYTQHDTKYIYIPFEDSDVLFGNSKYDSILNHFLILLKYCIYCCRRNESTPNFHVCKLLFKKTMETEKSIAEKNNTVLSFQSKWGIFEQILKTV